MPSLYASVADAFCTRTFLSFGMALSRQNWFVAHSLELRCFRSNSTASPSCFYFYILLRKNAYRSSLVCTSTVSTGRFPFLVLFLFQLFVFGLFGVSQTPNIQRSLSLSVPPWALELWHCCGAAVRYPLWFISHFQCQCQIKQISAPKSGIPRKSTRKVNLRRYRSDSRSHLGMPNVLDVNLAR